MYGVSSIQTQEAWMFYKIKDEWSYSTPKSITIDLDTAEPDLRLAIGEPISFKAYRPFSNEEVIGAIEEFSCVTGHLKINNIECRAKDIQLSREWLESQGVEVSE